ncbi:glycosyltransferase family 4 protein [Methylotenera versatilis]|uniref:Glycosyl transferase group 1 n=1 Tax=Methylotenera versatilis (strain 301) TaxID=666681 RepID=D7DPA4_METV0|nr:glycosyltransferase family 4 protein [Methylotenera versatilis]ADI29148.1 glycosyl transferase group 1 [Methylotenera versatilis 301]
MIAIVYPQFYGVGGIARYLDSFLANLPVDHSTIYLITGDEHRVDRHYANVELIHLPFSSSRFNLFFWSLKARKILNELYKQRKIQYINLHIPPLIPGLFMPRHIPLILTAHTTYIGMSGRFYKTQYFVSQWRDFEVNIKLWLESRIFKQAVKIITLTEQGRQELLTYGVTKPIEIIPNGVDTSLFTQDLTVAKDYDVLFCGRIEHRKGSRAMVKVCLALIQQKPDIRILIVGYGDDDVWVKSHLSNLTENINLTGKVSFSDMQHYYQRSKLYVSTSYYEGLPGTCLEAMAMGLPTIAWDFLFYQGLVEQDETGCLVEPNNIREMAKKIISLLESQLTITRMQQNTRVHVERDFNWRRLSKRILSVFE